MASKESNHSPAEITAEQDFPVPIALAEQIVREAQARRLIFRNQVAEEEIRLIEEDWDTDADELPDDRPGKRKGGQIKELIGYLRGKKAWIKRKSKKIKEWNKESWEQMKNLKRITRRSLEKLREGPAGTVLRSMRPKSDFPHRRAPRSSLWVHVSPHHATSRFF